MSTRVVTLIALACAMLGMWLPSLWLAPAPSVPPPAASPLLSLQSVVTQVAERDYDAASTLEDLEDLPSLETKALGRMLAGEQAGRHVEDSTGFLKALRQRPVGSVLEYSILNAFEYGALQAWADADPAAALTALIKSSGSGIRSRYAIIRQLSARLPDKALAVLRSEPAGRDFKRLWAAVLSGCIDRDPGAALAVIQSAPSAVRAAAIKVLLEKHADRDPRAALAWRESLPPELREGADPEIVYVSWSKSDPATVVKDWEQHGPGKLPPFYVLRAWVDQDPEAFFQWTLQNENGARADMAVMSMTAVDMDRALQMLAQTSGKTEKATLSFVAKIFVRSDSRAALTWWRSLPAEKRPAVLAAMLPGLSSLSAAERQALAGEVNPDTPSGFETLSELDPGAAEKALAGLSPVQAGPIYKAMAKKLLEPSPAAAASFVSKLVPALSDPAAAAVLADPESEDPDAATMAVLEIVANLTTSWAARDPAPPAAWLATLPAGKLRTAATANLAFTWGRYDLPAARTWVEQLPPGEARDKAAKQITRLTKSSGE